MIQKSNQKEITEIQTKLQGVLGQKAWGVARGQGSFMTIEFGQPIPPTQANEKSHGEWHLWLYGCAWRLEQGESVVVASEDDPLKIEAVIQCIEGHVLQSFELMTLALDAVLSFESDIVLRLFSVSTEEMDSWMLFTPEKVITVGPAGQWSYEVMTYTYPFFPRTAFFSGRRYFVRFVNRQRPILICQLLQSSRYGQHYLGDGLQWIETCRQVTTQVIRLSPRLASLSHVKSSSVNSSWTACSTIGARTSAG